MNVSPLDLRQQKFRTAFRGFDPVEVTSFLLAVADDYEQALRDTDKLRQEVARLEMVVRGHVEQEKSLQNTLITAQRLSDDIKAGAEDDAERIVRDAESRSALLIEKTQARVEDIQRDIDGLKLKRRDVETSLEASIQALRSTLEFVREQDARDRDDKLLTYRPRLAEPEAKAG
ncbi:MAG TPA: DivIVA domain-containing protein [Vicinamibacterales bacterium]|nr:DivIVA domain-containing protein [Vicinamibacterales bacterium]